MAEVLLSDLIRRAAGYLERHDVDSPLANAEALLASILGTDRSGIYRRKEGLSAAETKLFGRALCRRSVGTPLQHITGVQGFRRLTLEVRPGVFVPRPETETVVEVGLAAIHGVDAPRVVDIGTGSGAIALAIADEHPGARVVAIDRSPEAVALTKANAERMGLDLVAVEGDLWDGVPPQWRGEVDLVITNPPYLEADDHCDLPVDVRTDPRSALIGGMAMHARLLIPAAGWLRSAGTFVTEIDDEQGATVSALAEAAGLVDVAIHQDLNQRDRAVSGKKP